MLQLGRKKFITVTKPPPRAPEKAKTKKRRAPAKAKEPKWDSTGFKVFRCAGDREAENTTERYLNRYTDKAVEVWIEDRLAYRAYGLDHPLSTWKPPRRFAT